MSFTIKEVALLTQKYFSNRIDYMKRDVLIKVIIKEQKIINVKDKTRPQIKFIIETQSYPQYYPYNKHTGGVQRKYRHEYDSVLELDVLSVNSTAWVYRLGSGRKWEDSPPQSQIKQIYKKTRRIMKRRADRRGSTNKERLQLYRELVAKHRKRAKYLDVGDYNSKVNGINADFYFRDVWAFHKHGHLFGRQYSGVMPSPETNPGAIPFFPKHTIRLIDILLQRGILKDD